MSTNDDPGTPLRRSTRSRIPKIVMDTSPALLRRRNSLVIPKVETPEAVMPESTTSMAIEEPFPATKSTSNLENQELPAVLHTDPPPSSPERLQKVQTSPKTDNPSSREHFTETVTSTPIRRGRGRPPRSRTVDPRRQKTVPEVAEMVIHPTPVTLETNTRRKPRSRTVHTAKQQLEATSVVPDSSMAEGTASDVPVVAMPVAETPKTTPYRGRPPRSRTVVARCNQQPPLATASDVAMDTTVVVAPPTDGKTLTLRGRKPRKRAVTECNEQQLVDPTDAPADSTPKPKRGRKPRAPKVDTTTPTAATDVPVSSPAVRKPRSRTPARKRLPSVASNSPTVPVQAVPSDLIVHDPLTATTVPASSPAVRKPRSRTPARKRLPSAALNPSTPPVQAVLSPDPIVPVATAPVDPLAASIVPAPSPAVRKPRSRTVGKQLPSVDLIVPTAPVQAVLLADPIALATTDVPIAPVVDEPLPLASDAFLPDFVEPTATVAPTSGLQIDHVLVADRPPPISSDATSVDPPPVATNEIAIAPATVPLLSDPVGPGSFHVFRNMSESNAPISPLRRSIRCRKSTTPYAESPVRRERRISTVSSQIEPTVAPIVETHPACGAVNQEQVGFPAVSDAVFSPQSLSNLQKFHNLLDNNPLSERFTETIKSTPIRGRKPRSRTVDPRLHKTVVAPSHLPVVPTCVASSNIPAVPMSPPIVAELLAHARRQSRSRTVDSRLQSVPFVDKPIVPAVSMSQPVIAEVQAQPRRQRRSNTVQADQQLLNSAFIFLNYKTTAARKRSDAAAISSERFTESFKGKPGRGRQQRSRTVAPSTEQPPLATASADPVDAPDVAAPSAAIKSPRVRKPRKRTITERSDQLPADSIDAPTDLNPPKPKRGRKPRAPKVDTTTPAAATDVPAPSPAVRKPRGRTPAHKRLSPAASSSPTVPIQAVQTDPNVLDASAPVAPVVAPAPAPIASQVDSIKSAIGAITAAPADPTTYPPLHRLGERVMNAVVNQQLKLSSFVNSNVGRFNDGHLPIDFAAFQPIKANELAQVTPSSPNPHMEHCKGPINYIGIISDTNGNSAYFVHDIKHYNGIQVEEYRGIDNCFGEVRFVTHGLLFQDTVKDAFALCRRNNMQYAYINGTQITYYRVPPKIHSTETYLDVIEENKVILENLVAKINTTLSKVFPFVD